MALITDDGTDNSNFHSGTSSDNAADDQSSSSSTSSNDDTVEDETTTGSSSSSSMISTTSDEDDHNDNDDESLLSSLDADDTPLRQQCPQQQEQEQTFPSTTKCQFAYDVQRWTQRIPIGMNLCPWAIKSQSQNLLRYVTCPAKTATDHSTSNVYETLVKEAKALVQLNTKPWSTTLLICPHVIEWKDNFNVFDSWVKQHENSLNTIDGLENKLTLVTFHPQFLKWRDLPPGIGVGSQVLCSKGIPGISREEVVTTMTDGGGGSDADASVPALVPCTIIEANNSRMFGKRKVKIRYNHHDNDNDQKKNEQQYVPIDWLVFHEEKSEENPVLNVIGKPLIDNMMHQTPYPTIHLIRNDDLIKLSLKDVSRVKRYNIQRMKRLEE